MDSSHRTARRLRPGGLGVNDVFFLTLTFRRLHSGQPFLDFR